MEFILKTTIKAPAEEIYKAYLSSEGHTAITGGEANISDRIGELFTAWDGYIEGTILELEPHKRILQSWRTTQFLEEEEDSRLEILLEEREGVTKLTLIHTQVPESGEHYKAGWVEHYFNPMKAYFSE